MHEHDALVTKFVEEYGKKCSTCQYKLYKIDKFLDILGWFWSMITSYDWMFLVCPCCVIAETYFGFSD